MINKENMMKSEAGMSYVQIWILVFSFFAISYIIYSETELVSAIPADVAQASPVINPSGTNTETVCCEGTKSGNTCQNTAPNQCNSSLRAAPTECEFTDFCDSGCCVSSVTGLCNERTSRRDCTNNNGTFQKSPLCAVSQCIKGCCILANGVKWTTEKNCKFEGNSVNKDVPTEWLTDEEHNSEIKCLVSSEKGKEGACVYESGGERKCVYTTLEDCIIRTGSETNFDVSGKFCSDKSLNTTCKAKDHKGCLEAEEDVYWFDSCNNHEDVAEDCSLSGGSYCGAEGSNFVCKDVNCRVDGQIRRNGESWCEYDGAIGVDKKKGIKDQYGRDTVGSRHVKHICFMGTERIEPCADYRNEICVQSDASTPEGSFSQASCRINTWRMCLSYNSKNTGSMESKCKKNPDCFVKQIDMDGGFNFKVCLPSYPPGFNLEDEYTLTDGMEVPNSGETICSIANQRCTETWICGIFGCFCVDSCKCHTCYFTQKMNEFCASLGDCGAKSNYVGVSTGGAYGLRSTGAAPPRCVSGKEFVKDAKPIPGQKADPGNFEFFETLHPGSLKDISGVSEEMSSNITSLQRELLAVSGAYGSPLLLKILGNENDTLDPAEIASINQKPVDIAGFYNGFGSVQSAISSQIVYKERKAGGFEMLGAMMAALIAYIITQSILIALLAAMLAFLFLMAWIMYVHIDFTCDMWERPSGGADCNKCNKMEVPCTQYRCQSLGALCKFVNKGTPNELCISREPNGSAPMISPLYNVLSANYSYVNVRDNGFDVVDSRDNGCVEAFTTVRIGISVTPFAKCKFGVDPKQTFEEMPEKFGVKGNSILPAHQMELFFPSPEAIKNSYGKGVICNVSGVYKPCNLTDEQIKKLTEIDLYVKCKTADGKINTEPYHIKSCVKPGPDLTAPRITLTQPENKGFVKYNTDAQNITMYVNEPADCKWSTTDKDYLSMNNSFSCNQNIIDYTMFGLKCTTELYGLKNNSKFYIRCRDLSENKNTMSQSYVYQLFVSQTDLIIEEMRPENGETISAGSQPAIIKLKLMTSGGAKNGNASCKWEMNGGLFSDYFTETNSNYHSYDLNTMIGGRYNINFSCEDSAGNTASNISSFRVLIDNSGPQIIRIYNEGGLKIMTDEKSECRYSFDRNFDFDNATLMSGDEFEHYAEWQNRNYYIQCRDEFGNKGGKIIVKPYEVFSN